MKSGLRCIEPLEARIAPAFAAVFELSSIDGRNGFELSGEAAADFSGRSVSDAGDVNGDGFGDLIIGAPIASPNGSYSGASYVVFGKAGGFAADLNLSTLDGSNGFKLSGVAAFDESGRSVSDAGDVNGDSFDDLIIGAFGADPNGDGSRASYVVFGKASGFAANLNLSTLDGGNGFKLSGVAALNYSTGSVSGAGDVNGDGFGDLIIVTSGADPNGFYSGARYVVFGKASGFAADLNLSTLNGSNGFTLSGLVANETVPGSVSGAGDVNGDGFGDLIIGAPTADSNGTFSGASYVVFGKASGFAADLNLSSLNGTNGFKLSGVGANDVSGGSVSAAGDVNGDGFGDLIVGARGADPNGPGSGTSYVVFGKPSGFAADLNLATLIGPNGFKLNGGAAGDYSGGSVSAAGDVNGDGFGDLIIGADRASSNGRYSGASYVVFGKASGFAPNLKLSTLDGRNGFTLHGGAAYDRSGGSVSAAGDVNGDGFGDLIIGIGAQSGASYVVFGQGGSPLPSIAIGDATAAEGDAGTTPLIFPVILSFASAQTVTVQFSTVAGTAAAGRDYTAVVNQTLEFAPGETSKMIAVTVFGETVNEPDETVSINLSSATNVALSDRVGLGLILDNDSLELSSLDGSNGFKLSGVATYDLSGTAVSDAGDVNGDGFGDLIIGANRASPNGIGSGASYVVFGQVSGIAANLNLSALDGRNGFKLSGAAEYDYSGYSVSAAGDFNGDGFGDLIIGARGADPNGFDSGASYVVFGKASGFAADLNLSTLDGSNGFKLSGVAEGDRSGASVSAAGDVNGDGFGDLIIGADSADPNGYSSGASYVVFGKASGFAANLDLSTLDGRNGFTLNGVAAYDRSGGSVSAAGDVNGDGFGDLIIGAHGADPNGNYSGASYVVFGGASELGANLNLSALDGRNGFKLSGVAENRAGDSVSAAGDVNGDGFDDLIVGAYQAYSDSRASYVVFGQESGFAANLNLSTLDGSNGFKLSGSSGPVSDAGDVNGDGFDDLIIGAFSAYHYGSFSGASYVVFGQASGFAANLNLGTLDGGNGFRLSGGAAPDNSGASVSAAGDINGDGFDDLIIGAPVASPSGSYSGASYVVFGQGRPALPSVSIGDATAAEGDAGTSLVMFPVTLSFGSTQTVTVQFSTVDGTATAGRDYTAVVNQTLEFAPGETIKMIAATVLGDTVVEPDETFFGNLSSVTNAALATPHGLGLIPDDDSLELSSLEGSNGFKLSGVAANDGSGGSVSAAGDVNGDGFGDLIIGAQRAGPNGDVSGASYVVFGKASAFSADLNLSGLDGSNGFKLSGVAAYDYSGSSVSAAGDVNGDGFDDLIIGASRAYANGRNSGASYVVFGKASGFGADLNLSALDGSNGFKLSGVAAYDSSGGSVSAAGDVNGDGFGDLIIGARGADPNGYNSGASYVVFGNGSAFSADLNLSALDGSNGFKLSGVAANDYSGSSVSAAGDVNGDGFDDLIIGAYGADPNRTNSGASYVVFGKASGFAANLNLSALDGSNGFKLSGVAADDRSGGWVSAAGDVNGDGYGELIIGARGADPNGSRSGASYVVFGKASGFAANLNLSTLDGSNGFTLNGVARDSAGGSVSAAGDVNGDGFGDLIIGALGASPNGTYSGASYVVFGKSNAFAVDFNLSTLDGRNGFTLNGVAEGDNSGESVSAAGDVNGDGFGDLIIGARLADPNGSRSGASYVVFGQGGSSLPSVSIGDGMAAEGEAGTSSLMFPVTLSFASTQTVTVQFSTVDGTASAGSDYTVLVNQTLQFAPGETTRMITVNLLGDTTVESDENLSVVFSSATKATITDGTGVGTILNDDVPELSIGDAALAEGDSGTTTLAFAVTLSRSSLSTVSVRVSTVDGAATAGTDFTALNSLLVTFAPGEISKLVTVVSLSDAIAEADETFSVLLSGATNATIANGTGTGTILNDDAPTRPRVQITDASVLEGHSGPRALTFTVSLSAETTLPVSVNFASAAGTSPAGTDYAALTPGILTFAPGETMKTITVDVLGDIVVEPSEMFSVLLSEAVNADIEDGTGLGTILDDDVTLLGKRGVTFTDVDGERVTIKVSKGTLKVEDFTIVPSGSGAQLALVDFSGETEFAGVNLSITAKRAAGTVGDRLVDVGAINASGIDLGNVVIKGDLGQIDAGDDRDPRPGLLSLRADSLGRRGLDTQLPGGSLQSDIAGAFKTLNLASGVQDAALSVSGDIGAVTIKGSILGSAIRSDGKIGALKISGDLAASATSAATISARGATTVSDALAFGKITIGGSVEHAQILAGYDRFGEAANVDASIGAVSVGRNWIASDLVAGAIAGADGLFGTDDDALVSRGNPLIAKIASIVIKGTISGTEGGTDHFGFVAEQIAAFSSGGARIALTPGPSNDIAGASVSPSGNVKVREAA